MIPESLFPEAKVGTTYVAPQVLIDVDHSMLVMTEETFGPVVGIMKVRRHLDYLGGPLPNRGSVHRSKTTRRH